MLQVVYNIYEIAEMAEAAQVITNSPMLVKNVCTDTRQINKPAESIFIALAGVRDGHDFIEEAYAKGIRTFMVNKLPEDMGYDDASYILVADTLTGLQLWAEAHRKRYRLEVIGITGSNGKTVVKEWLRQLMHTEFNIFSSPRSYNSQLGVALTVLGIGPENTLGIIEAGISLPNEMERLEQMIKPTVGVLTNIGSAHDAGFTNREQKTEEKLKLFKNCGALVCNVNLTGVTEAYKTTYWTLEADKPAANVILKILAKQKQSTVLECEYTGEKFNITIPFTDAPALENAATCITVMLLYGYDSVTIIKRIAALEPIEMRMRLLKGINNCDLLDDSYSADLFSLNMALDFLNQQFADKPKTVILSDMISTGLTSEQLSAAIADMLKKNGVSRLVAVGEKLAKHCALFGFLKAEFYSDTDSVLRGADISGFRDQAVLVKGARRFNFEKITKALSAQQHETTLEVNLNALESNVQYYRSLLNENTGIMAMVKAFSYGAGSYEIANKLAHTGVEYLSVAFADEGIALRRAGVILPIMVMSPTPGSIADIIKYSLEPEIYSMEILRLFKAEIPAGNRYNIHIKIDTGMHRLGFMAAEISELCREIADDGMVCVKSVFTHLAAAEDETEDNFTDKQLRIYDAVTSEIQERLGYDFIRHVCNTAGITRWPQAQYDMVRLGIGMYGYNSANDNMLNDVLVLKTTVTQIKKLQAGESVGYNRKGIVQRDSRIATVKIGYADGYSRKYGNGAAYMMVNDKKAYTIGNICMDMCMLDVTDIACKVGDEVIIMGDRPSAKELALAAGTIPYEVFTNIAGRVKRVYTYD